MMEEYTNEHNLIDNTYDEGVVDQLQNILFVFNVINVLALDDIILFHCFQGEFLVLVFFEVCNLDISKCTYKIKNRYRMISIEV